MVPERCVQNKNWRLIMAAWNVESVLALSRAFMESRLLLTGAELNVFTLLTIPKTLKEVVDALGSDMRGTEILLDALTAIGLIDKRDVQYVCPPETAALLSAAAPGSVLPMVLHSASVWQRWSDLSKIVRTGKTVAPPAGLFENEELKAFIFAMHVIGIHGADEIAECARADVSRALLDVGGATGTYAEAFLRRHTEMRATIFDRAPVIEMAGQRLATSEVRDRITLVPGDFYNDPLPGGHDLVLLSAIIHQNGPEQNVDLYRKCFDALVPGGRILIRDFVMSSDRIRPVGGAVFAVNMLAATEGGNCYTLEEIQDTLSEAGFVRVSMIQDGDRMDAVVEAFKP
jgi:SAM-dependent methyltransferase